MSLAEPTFSRGQTLSCVALKCSSVGSTGPEGEALSHGMPHVTRTKCVCAVTLLLHHYHSLGYQHLVPCLVELPCIMTVAMCMK